MAGDNEPIGSLPIEITGDFSELQTALNDAASAAQAGSDQIVDALQGVIEASGLAGGDLAVFQSVLEADQQAGIELAQSLQDLSQSAASVGETVAGAAVTALEQLETAEQGAGEGASQASQELDELASNSEHANEAAEQGESAWGEFGETLLEFGGIALTAEGLKELATEALETYGNVEKATIALTALTGSAGEATETIENLKTLALTDALSFPSLVQADQRMTAFGFSAEAIPGVLQAAADAAAATGRNFDTVTNSIERMSLSGTAGARQLATLGITLGDLATALNTTDADAKQAFKDLDVSDRVEAITDALSKYEGVAESVAQGVLGQFQNLKTQTEFIFESIGQAVAPAAQAFMSFASDVVLPEVQNIANAYKDWSGSVTDLLGTLSQAGSELINTATNASGLGSSLDQTNQIIKQTAQDSFTDAFLPALHLATAGMQELSLGFQVLTGLTPGADSMIQLMTQHLSEMGSAAQMGGAAFSDAFAISVRQATGSMAGFSSGAQYVVDNVAKLNQNIADGKEVLGELITASDGSAASLQAIAAQSASVEKAQKTLASALGETTKATKDQVDSWQALIDTTDKQATAFQNAQDTFDAVSSAYNDGKDTLNGLAINLQTVTEAQNNLNTAFQKYTGMVAQWTDSASNVAAVVQTQANQFTKLQNAVDQTNAAFVAQQKAYNDAVAAGTDTDKMLQLLQIAYNDNQKAIAALSKAVDTTGVSMADLTGKASDAATVLVNGASVAVTSQKALEGLASASDTAGVNQQAFTGFVADGTTKIGDMVISTNAASVGLDSEAASAGKASVAVVANTAAANDNAKAKKAAADASQQLQQMAQKEDQAWQDGLIVMQNYAGVLVTETTAATDAATGSADLATAVKNASQMMTDAISGTNAYADSLLAISADADDAADAVENLNNATAKSGKGGGSGSSGSLTAYLADAIDIAQNPATGGALGGGGVNQGYIDQMAQELADATGQVVTTLDGQFIPAAQQAAEEAQAQANMQAAANAATSSNTTATVSNTTATVAATQVLNAAQTSFINTATAGDQIVTSFSDLPGTIQDYLDSLNGTLVAYDDTTGALQFTEQAAGGLTTTFNAAVAANELASSTTTTAAASTATALQSVATAATSTGEAISGLATVAETATTAVNSAAQAITAAATAQSSTLETTTGPLSNALYAGIGGGSTAGAFGTGQYGTPLNGYSSPNPGLTEASTGSPYSSGGITLIVQVSGNTVASDASIQMLANKVASSAITQLRTIGGFKN